MHQRLHGLPVDVGGDTIAEGLAVRDIGALPLAICRWAGVRVLEWAAKDYTDYCDALLRPGVEPALRGPTFRPPPLSNHTWLPPPAPISDTSMKGSLMA